MMFQMKHGSFVLSVIRKSVPAAVGNYFLHQTGPDKLFFFGHIHTSRYSQLWENDFLDP